MAQATAQNSSFYASMSVFTGNVLASLSPVADNMFSPGQPLQFVAIQGRVYDISVDDMYGAGGDVVLNVATLAPSLSVSIDPASGNAVFNLIAAADLDYI